jgi:alkylation response protein AidB-like acyl-CoA dehydrogenase
MPAALGDQSATGFDRLPIPTDEGPGEPHAKRNARMSTWAWVGVGLGAFFLITALASLALAAILGRVSSEASELFDGVPSV